MNAAPTAGPMSALACGLCRPNSALQSMNGQASARISPVTVATAASRKAVLLICVRTRSGRSCPTAVAMDVFSPLPSPKSVICSHASNEPRVIQAP